MRTLIIALALAASTAAHAQQQQTTPEQAAAMQLGSQVGLLMHENAVLRSQLQQAQARVKELEAQASARPEPAK